jgi:uncharacterized protein (DUF1697 family)
MNGVVALLRAVNVGGTKPVAMAVLRSELEAAGFAGVKTLLHSGNAVFDAGRRTDTKVEAAIEALLARRFDVRTDVLVRNRIAWTAVIDENPFPAEAKDAPAKLYVMALRASPDAARVAALQAAVAGPEQIRAGSNHLYITYPEGSGNSKLTAAVIERTLGTRGTARNWNTVLKIDAALAAL